MVQQFALGAQGVWSHLSTVFKGLSAAEGCRRGSTAIRTYLDTSKDPWITGDAAKAPAVLVL